MQNNKAIFNYFYYFIINYNYFIINYIFIVICKNN